MTSEILRLVEWLRAWRAGETDDATPWTDATPELRKLADPDAPRWERR